MASTAPAAQFHRLLLTGAAGGLGPTLTGVLTPFPVSNTVLAAFVLVLEGPAHANAFLRG